MTKFLAFAIALLGFNKLNAQEFKTQSVALFKDGNAFFIKKGRVATTNKTFLLKDNEIPQATLGSLWFYSNTNPITAITAFTDTLRKDVEIQTSNDYALLYLNKGKKVTIVLEKEKVEGVVENATRQENNIDRYGNPTGLNTVFDIILFKTTDGRFMTLKAHDIKRVEFTEKPITVYKVPYKEPVNIVSINFEKENKTSDLDAMYIQKGLQWNPFYHLQLLDDSNAQLTLRAEVSNDIENLQNIDMSFVIGVPNFLYSHSLTDLVNFLKVSSNDNAQNRYLNNYAQNLNISAYSVPYARSSNLDNINLDNQLEGNNVGDLYFYKIPNFSMKKGEKSHLQLFTHKVKYDHIFECNLPKYDVESNQNYNYTENNKIKVFHSAKVYNETPNPFTTGSCLITQKKENTDFPLGQDVLRYTSKKSNTYVKITETPDIKITQSEKILEKAQEPFEFWGRNFYKVKIEGKIKISSYKSDVSKMELRYNILGTTKNSSQEWKISQQDVNLNSPNLNNLVCWDFNLKAAEVKEITYQYETYVYR